MITTQYTSIKFGLYNQVIRFVDLNFVFAFWLLNNSVIVLNFRCKLLKQLFSFVQLLSALSLDLCFLLLSFLFFLILNFLQIELSSSLFGSYHAFKVVLSLVGIKSNSSVFLLFLYLSLLLISCHQLSD